MCVWVDVSLKIVWIGQIAVWYVTDVINGEKGNLKASTVVNYLENTLENTLCVESLVVGADSVSDLPGSPVNPSTHDSGYDKRFNI